MEQLEQDAVVSAMQLKKLRDENAFLKKDSSTLKSRLLSIFTSLKLPMPYLPTTRNIDQYIQMLYENIQRFFKSDPLAAATYLEKVLDVVTNPPPPPPA